MAKSRRAAPKATRRAPVAGKPAAAATKPAARRTPPPAARARHAAPKPAAPRAATEQTQYGYKVRATQTGYYDHARRREGDVFLIAKEEDFSEKWMEYVDGGTAERHSTANQEIRRKNVETAVERTPGLMPMAHDEPLANDPKNPLKA